MLQLRSELRTCSKDADLLLKTYQSSASLADIFLCSVFGDLLFDVLNVALTETLVLANMFSG